MRKRDLAVAVAALFLLHPVTAAAAADDYSGEELSADIITAVVPIATYTIAHFKDDRHGKNQFLRSVGASLVLNTALRVGFNNTSLGERPNGNQYGFPSGHTAFMASSAAFLQDRYGWKYGVPAYALTGYVAWVRVDTHHHRWRDVIAGTAVSVGVSRLFVTPQDAPDIKPVFGPGYVGLRWEHPF